MTEDYAREDLERERKERQEQARREAAEREKMSAYRSWITSGGTPRDFEAAWPKMRDEIRRRRVVEADEQARAAQRNAGTSRI